MKTAGGSKAINLRSALLRLARWGAILLVAGYVFAVAGGYLFLRYSRKIDEVHVSDVALFRFSDIRRTLARQHFRQAKEAWDAKDFQQAYVYYTSAVLRDPDNIDGRLSAAHFLEALGATNLEINLLEDGLVKAPDHRELNDLLFSRLLAAGRHRRALELLHGSHAAALTGPNAAFLQTVELQATLAVSGAPAAKAVIDQRPDLRHIAMAVPTVAQVLWDTGEKKEAIALAAALVKAEPNVLPARVLLADWLRLNGEEDAAIATALEAVRQFPSDPAARVLLFDVGGSRIRGTPNWWKEVGAYLKDFEASPKAVFLLASLAGRRGWLDLSGTLYELGARRGHDLGMLGLFYSDALVQNARLPEAQTVLQEIDLQSAERNTPFQLQVRQRTIAAAAAANDREAVRENARRLATLLRNDTDTLQLYRQHYLSIGLTDAVAELSERKARPAGTPAVRGS